MKKHWLAIHMRTSMHMLIAQETESRSPQKNISRQIGPLQTSINQQIFCPLTLSHPF